MKRPLDINQFLSRLQNSSLNEYFNHYSEKAKPSKFAGWMKTISAPSPVVQEKELQLLLRTHTSYQSNAEILIPKQFKLKVEINEILLIQIDQSTESFLVQVTPQSLQENPILTHEISILDLIVNRMNVNYEDNGSRFKAKVSKLQESKYSKYNVQYVEVFVKGQYVSPYDRYRISNQLTKYTIYPLKTLTFQNIRLQVLSLFSNGDIPKMGIITKDTKIIYRSASSNHTFLIQFTKQMFDLDYYQQIYIERVIQFLKVYTLRNNLFQTNHSIQVVIFARLYYPQFKTLNQAYDFMVGELDKLHSQDPSKIYSKNLALAFQKDKKNRIYEDCFRKIIWCQHYGSLTQFIWKKMTQFLYTINWKQKVRPLAQKILDRIRIVQQNKMNQQNTENNPYKFKLKPFVRLLECELSQSQNSNILEAITLSAESQANYQYGVNLSMTGNAITILTAGHSKYYSDPTTYRLAKSSIYLTNTSCIVINLRQKKQLQFILMTEFSNLVQVGNPKMQRLLYKCLDRYIYSSIMPEVDHSEISSFYENRFGVRLQLLTQITKQNENQFFKNMKMSKLSCGHQFHYAVKEDNNLKASFKYSQKIKFPKWIHSCYFGKSCLRLHHKYFDLSREYDPAKLYLYGQHAFQSETIEIYRRADQNLFAAAAFKNTMNSNKIKIKYNCESNIENLIYSTPTKQLENALFQNQIIPKISLTKGKIKQFGPDMMLVALTKAVFSSQQFPKNKTREIEEQMKNNIDCNKGVKSIMLINRNSNIFRSDKFSLLDMSPCMFFSNFSRKSCSQYAYRLKYNYEDLGIHYIMPWFTQDTIKNIKSCILISGIESSKTQKQLQIERSWKLICFPLLTPFTTTADMEGMRIIPRQNTTSTKPKYIQSLVGQKLCEGFQLILQSEKDTNNSLVYHLMKGHLYYPIQFIGQRNIVIRECQVIHKNNRTSLNYHSNQQLIKALDRKYSNMIYRYLCYQQKQLRFLPKRTFFKSDDSWHKNKKSSQKKIRISIVIDTSNQFTIDKQKYRESCGQCFKQFIRSVNEKYKYLTPSFQIKTKEQLSTQKEQKILIKLKSLDPQLILFKEDTFTLTYQSGWNINCVFNIEITWLECTGVYINEFLNSILSMAKVGRKIIPYVIPGQTAVFKSQRKFSCPAQILFSCQLSMDMLMTAMKDQWVWDRSDFYFKKDGFCFVKFIKHKRIALWKDNFKQIAEARQLPENQFISFFIKAFAHDILGEILDRILSST